MGRTLYQELVTESSSQALPFGKPVKFGKRVPDNAHLSYICECGYPVSTTAESEGRFEKIGNNEYRVVCWKCATKKGIAVRFLSVGSILKL